MRCDDVRPLFPELAGGDGAIDLRAQRHIDSCTGCQTRLREYRTLVRTLGGLRELAVEPPPGLLFDVIAAIDNGSSIRARVRRHRGALAGAAGAVAAGALATVVLVVRSRRRLALAAA